MDAKKVVSYKSSVQKDLRTLGHVAAVRIINKIEKSIQSIVPPGEALSGEFAGLWKIRVGDYRAIYCQTAEGYLILRIAHRRQGKP